MTLQSVKNVQVHCFAARTNYPFLEIVVAPEKCASSILYFSVERTVKYLPFQYNSSLDHTLFIKISRVLGLRKQNLLGLYVSTTHRIIRRLECTESPLIHYQWKFELLRQFLTKFFYNATPLRFCSSVKWCGTNCT